MSTKSFLIALAAMMLPLVVSADTKVVTVDGIKYRISDNGPTTASVTQNVDISGDLVIPRTITIGNTDYTVTAIEDKAFMGCNNITSINIPNSVESIGVLAFSGSVEDDLLGLYTLGTKLISVTIGSGVKSIGANAFGGCKNLKDVYISDLSAWCGIKFGAGNVRGALDISDENPITFQEGELNVGNPLIYAKHLYINGNEAKDMIIPDGVTKINSYVFNGCNMTSITIPNSVTIIGEKAFEGCDNLTSVTIPKSVTRIEENAFRGCNNLTSVYISDIAAWCKITTESELPQPYHLFMMGEEIKDLIIPDGIKTINRSVFSGCKYLTSVTIPKSVTRIEENAFRGCNNLTSVYISDIAAWCTIYFRSNPLYYARHLYVKDEEITELVIPDEVKSIGKYAFEHFSELTSVKISNNVTSIGVNAFCGCPKLNNVTLGKSVKMIYTGAFADCDDLSDVTCFAANVPTTESNVFSHPERITLHVPEESIPLYKGYNPWASFKSIVKTEKTSYALTYMVDGEVYKSYDIKYGSTIIPESEPVKEGYTFSGWSEIPEEMPAYNVVITGTFTLIPLGQCSAPTINIENGEVVFACDTKGVQYHYDIQHFDVKRGDGNNIRLTNTYRISVYASKEGYEDSDVTTKDLQFAVGKKGDVDGDGNVNAADVVHLTNIIMSMAE